MFLALPLRRTTVTLLYRRAGNGMGFLRTGLGRARVVADGGAIVVPLIHRAIPFNLRTVMLAIERRGAHALTTRDGAAIDIAAQFHVRIGRDPRSLTNAAGALGTRLLSSLALAALIEEPLADSLRTAAAAVEIGAFRADRAAFIRAVHQDASARLAHYGLNLRWFELTMPGRFSTEREGHSREMERVADPAPVPAGTMVSRAAGKPGEDVACQNVVSDAAAILSSGHISLATKVALLKLLPEIISDAAAPQGPIDHIKTAPPESGPGRESDPAGTTDLRRISGHDSAANDHPMDGAWAMEGARPERTAFQPEALPALTHPAAQAMAWQRPMRWRRT